jgi:glucose/arabinose dehydrogenase
MNRIFALLLAVGLAACNERGGAAPISADVFEAAGWRAEVVVDGLEHPWSITWLADGTALITERPGRLRLLRNGRLEPQPVSGLPTLFASGQGGLLDVSLHPDFASNRLVYLTLSIGSSGANRTALARGRLVGNALQDVELIFRNPDSKSGGQHFGSRMLWLPDNTLLMSIGDGGNPPISFNGENIRKQAQNPARLFGKIIHLNDDGSPAAGNPFAAQAGNRPEVWTIGHRNIQGLARDPRSGQIWATEHASRGGDELNLIEAGNNYGWPEVSYSNEYWGPPVSELSSRADVTEPVLVWTPSKAPSGLAVYTGEAFPQWQGDLFSGALKFQHIRRIKLDGRRVVAEEKLTIGKRVRDVRQGPDGYLYVLTDESDGALLRIVPQAE